MLYTLGGGGVLFAKIRAIRGVLDARKSELTLC
jgi:hypothetical protein